MSSFWLQEESDTRQDPKLLIEFIRFHPEFGNEDKSWASHSSDIHWAVIETCTDLEPSLNCSDVHDWQFWCEFLGDHITQVTLLATSAFFPCSTL